MVFSVHDGVGERSLLAPTPLQVRHASCIVVSSGPVLPGEQFLDETAHLS
jgi:hypothetical protein